MLHNPLNNQLYQKISLTLEILITSLSINFVFRYRYTGHGHNRPLSHGVGGYHRPTQSAPLSNPDHMRHMQNPSRQPHPYPGNYGNNQASNHPGHYPPSTYPSPRPNHGYSNSSGVVSSLPTGMPQGAHQPLYPSLPMDERHYTYPNEGMATSGPSLEQRRRNFLRNYKGLYTEDVILEVFKNNPNETNEQRLHQLIQRYLKF